MMQVPKAQTALQANGSGLGVALSASHAFPQSLNALWDNVGVMI
jgi:hypothetical protein